MNKGTKWEYTNESRFELRALAKDISRAELLIAMYEAFCVDESLYDLKLEAAYVWAGRPMPPLILASDQAAFQLFFVMDFQSFQLCYVMNFRVFS